MRTDCTVAVKATATLSAWVVKMFVLLRCRSHNLVAMLPLSLDMEPCYHSSEHVYVFFAHLTLRVDLDPRLEVTELNLQPKFNFSISTVVLQSIWIIVSCLTSAIGDQYWSSNWFFPINNIISLQYFLVLHEVFALISLERHPNLSSTVSMSWFLQLELEYHCAAVSAVIVLWINSSHSFKLKALQC